MDVRRPFSAFSSSVRDTPLVCFDCPQPRHSLVVFAPHTPHIHTIGLSHHLHVHVYKWHDVAFVYVCECALVMLISLACPQLTAPDTDLQPPPLKKRAHNVSSSLLMTTPECAHAPCLFKEDVRNSLFVPQLALCKETRCELASCSPGLYLPSCKWGN